jgi:hypothetical protein
MMVTFTRSALIAPGKTREAMAFANQMVKLIKDKYDTKLEILVPIGGNPNRISWYARYETLAQWEALASKLFSDMDYMDAVARNSATFLPGSVNDDLWRTL